MTEAELLAELQRTFPAGQTTGTFDATQVASGSYATVLGQLGVPTTLDLESDDGWQLDGESVKLDGTVTTAVLGLPQAPVHFRFMPNGGDHAMVIDLTLPSSWRFGQSFTMLGAGVFERLTLDGTQQSALVIASGQAQDPLREVGGSVLTVASGLTFFGFFDANSDVLTQLEWLVTGGPPGAVIGQIAVDPKTGGVNMALPLAKSTVSGVFGDSGPEVDLELDLYCALNAVLHQYEMGVRFKTSVDFQASTGKAQTLDLTALLVADEGTLEFSLSGSALAFPSPDVLARFFGKDNGIATSLPDKFAADTTLVQIDDVTLGVGIPTKSFDYAFITVGATPDNPWNIGGVFRVDEFGLTFAVFNPLSPDEDSYAFTFAATLELAGVPIQIMGELPAETLTGGLVPGTEADLVPLVKHVFGDARGVPDDLAISELDFSADIQEGVYSAGIEIIGDWEFDVGGEEIRFEDLRLEFSHGTGPGGAGPAGEIAGRFAVGENEFTVTLDLAKAGAKFIGTWKPTKHPLDYQDIAIALGIYGLPNLPQGLDLAFTKASFEFDSTGPTFEFALDTTKGGAALIAGKSTAGQWGFVFGMLAGLDLKLDLTDIAVIGKLVPAGDDVIALEEARIVGATTALPAVQPSGDAKTIIGDSLNSGLALAAGIKVGNAFSDTLTIRFGGADDGSQADTPPASGAEPAPALPSPGPPSRLSDQPSGAAPGPQATWIDVQRSFGPVQLKRLGFAIGAGDRLSVLADGGVSIAGLSIGLIGLEIDVPTQRPFTPTFGLAGLDVQYSGGGLDIVGGLAKAPGKDEYTGILTLTFGNFGATAFGSYATANGQPSLFAFLFVDYPLGGPAFFFVTGMAGGFGYNRSLHLPSVADLTTYPLVAAARGTLNEQDTITQLNADIQPQVGEDWLAAGVRFTSFEMLRSFALVTVSFGAHVEIGLLGESTLSVPTAPPGETVTPVAQADLALLVDVDVTLGQLAVSAQLASDSYVFQNTAQLTGGFAFYVWFPPNAHTGDFVVTLGGYNPYFSPPDHYPKQVPRLGLSWKVSDQLSVTGGLYFALTPAVLMAGGTLHANWQSGDIRAWFDAQADALIRFKPFQYLIDVSVSIGASFTVDLLVTTKTITIHASSDLNIWGPPFGGQAKVDLDIISFTVGFGAGPPDPPPGVQWDEFRKSFLPAANQAEREHKAALEAAAGNGATPTDSLITITAPSGLAGTVGTGSAAPWLVHPGALTVAIATQMPSTVASVVTAADPQAPGGSWNKEFGIGPMGAEPGSVVSELNVTIDREGKPDPDAWTAQSVTGNVPGGLWHNTSSSLQGQSVVEDVLIGLTLEPVPPTGAVTVSVPVDELVTGDPVERDFAWSASAVPTSDPFDQSQALEQLESGLVDAATARSAILASLIAAGLHTAQTVDVTDFAANGHELLSSPPLLSLLGEIRQPPPGRQPVEAA